jgi:hypothetical protein
MTKIQFEALSVSDKHNTLLAHGVYLMYRHSEDYTILLFQVEDFYVELYYQKNNETTLDFRVFASTDQLDPYFNQMPLSLARLTLQEAIFSY